jgi:DNA-binding NarL/FixJ family response regulator
LTLRHRTVLVVDDDERFAAFLTTLLEGAGFRTVVATNADDALVAARADNVDAALVDVVLPGRGGYSLCHDLHKVDPDLPVIFISGERADAMDRAAGIIMGGEDYLVKPVHPDELLARLRRLLERSRPPAEKSAAIDLSIREIQVLQLVAEGWTPGEVGQRLFIAPKTVSSHMQRIFAKLGVHTRAQAVALAYEAGLIRVQPRDDRVEAHALVGSD